MNPFQSNPISFPGLGVTFNPPQTAFSLFGIDVKWYGIIITIGFLLAILYALKRSPEFGIGRDPLVDMLLVAVPAALIGARLYYVIFNFDLYRDNPIRVFYVREGGLAIYGAVIFGLLAGVLAARFKKIRAGAILDLASLGFLIGQAVGRWGNFMNREAFGSATSLPWRMRLIFGFTSQSFLEVHPCFLYESLWNLLGFCLLHLYSQKRRYDGEVFLMYVAWYGAGRGLIEILRIDSLFIPNTEIPVSMALGFFSAAVAVVLLIYNRTRSFDPGLMQAARYEASLKAVAASESGSSSDPADHSELSESDGGPEATEAELEIIDTAATSSPDRTSPDLNSEVQDPPEGSEGGTKE